MTVGENVTLSGFSLFRGGDCAFCHVPHVYEVVAAFDAGGQSVLRIVGDQLYEVVARDIIGAENAGRLNDDRVKPFFDIFQHFFRGHGFGFGVGALYFVGGKTVRFRKHPQRLFGNGVYRAYIDKLSDMVSKRKRQQVFRAFDVDAQQVVGHFVGDADEARRMNEYDVRAVGVRKQRQKGGWLRDIAEDIFRPICKQRGLAGQNEPAYPLSFFKKATDDCAAEVAVRARNYI